MFSIRHFGATAFLILCIGVMGSEAFAQCGPCSDSGTIAYLGAIEVNCYDLNEPGRAMSWGIVNTIDNVDNTMYIYECYQNGDPEHGGWWGACCSQAKVAPISAGPSAPPLNTTIACGSYITLEDRSVSESIPLIGVPFDLVYSSANSSAKTAAFTLDVPAIGPTVPSGVTSVDVSIQIAGRTFSQSYTTANSTYHLVWDGFDSSSNYVGSAIAHVTTTPHYSGLTQTWPVTTDFPIGIPVITTGIGSWRLSQVHFYDSVTSKIWEGNGIVRSVRAQALSPSGYRIPSRYGEEVYIFDSSGYHTQTLDGLTGATLLTIAYDSFHRASTLTDAYGNVTTINRTLLGVPTSIVGPYGQTTTLTMNSNNDLASVTGPDSSVYTVTYDVTGGLIATFTKPSGEVGTFTFATDGKLVSDASSSGPTMTYTDWYDYSSSSSAIHYTLETSVLGRTRQIADLASPNAGINKTITRSSGEITQISDAPMTQAASGGYASYDYGSGYSESTSIDGDIRFGRQVELESGSYIQNGNFTSLATSQILTPARSDDVTLPMSDPFTYTSLQTTRSVNGHNWVSLYTKSTGVETTTSPIGRISTETRNSTGQLTSSQYASFSPTSFSYDSNGRLHTITQNTRTTTVNYNSVGLVGSIVNPLSQTTSYTYDNANRVLTLALPDARMIAYTYDSGGNLASITPPSSPMHELISNVLGYLTNYKAPSLGSGTLDTLYSYNNDRQLTMVTRPDSSVINFNYGSTTGLLDSITSGSQTQSMTYLGGNRIGSTTSFDGVQLDFGYSRMQINAAYYYGTGAGNLYFTYNANTRLGSMQVGGTTVSFGYDDDDLLTTAESEALTRSSSTGAISSTALGNAMESFTYDSTYGELASYQAQYNSNNLFTNNFARDGLGRISTRTETVGTNPSDVYSYTYDSAGRLTDVTKNSVLIGHYVYDSNSNRTSSTNSAGLMAATYDAQDRLSTYGTKTFSYNLNGERTQQVDSSLSPGTTTYDWDVFGNLKQVTLPSVSQVNYQYDAFNRKVTKLSGTTVLERYIYLDQTRLAAVLDAAGAEQIVFVYGDRFTPEYMIKGGVDYKLFSDHVGSVRQVVNSATGVVAQELTYDEFGRVLSDSSPGFQPFGFAGGLYEKDTGLTQFGARWYDAEVGRWLSKDPILFDGGDTNLYGYVLQDPVNWIDSSGFSANAAAMQGGGGAIPFPLIPFMIPWPKPNPTPSPAGTGGSTGPNGSGAGAGSPNTGNPGSGSEGYPSCPLNGGPQTMGAGNNSDSSEGGHTKGARPSTKEKHQRGDATRKRNRGGEKGDENRDLPRIRPSGYKGPWPPK